MNHTPPSTPTGRHPSMPMTTTCMTHLDADGAVFEATASDRISGAFSVALGSAFASVPFLAWSAPRASAAGLGFGIVFGLTGLFLVADGLAAMARSDRLAIDFKGRTYATRRGYIPFAADRSGPLDDFDHVRLVNHPAGRRGRSDRWLVEWAWRDPGRPPIRVRGLRKPRSFRLYRGIDPGPETVARLRDIAGRAGVRLVLPDGLPEEKTPHLDRPGLGDPELDAPALLQGGRRG